MQMIRIIVTRAVLKVRTIGGVMTTATDVMCLMMIIMMSDVLRWGGCPPRPRDVFRIIAGLPAHVGNPLLFI